MEQQTVSIRDIAPRYKIIWAEFLEANGNERLTIDQHTAVFVARADYVRFFENVPGLKLTDTSPSVREIRLLLRAEKAAGIVSQAELAEQEARAEQEREDAKPTTPSALSAFLAKLEPLPLNPLPIKRKTSCAAGVARPTRQRPPSTAESREKARRLRQYLEEEVENGISAAGSYSVMVPQGMTLQEMEDILEPPARGSTRYRYTFPTGVWYYNPYPKDCRLGMQRTHRPDRL